MICACTPLIYCHGDWLSSRQDVQTWCNLVIHLCQGLLGCARRSPCTQPFFCWVLVRACRCGNVIWRDAKGSVLAKWRPRFAGVEIVLRPAPNWAISALRGDRGGMNVSITVMRGQPCRGQSGREREARHKPWSVAPLLMTSWLIKDENCYLTLTNFVKLTQKVHFKTKFPPLTCVPLPLFHLWGVFKAWMLYYKIVAVQLKGQLTGNVKWKIT